MRRVVLSLSFLVAVYTSFSQRIYFIYLQTESQQPFFVKMDEKLYSSTASGYLILSRLKDSAYNFTIGFPGNQAGEHKFSCLINHKDHGYLVKNYGEKGWGLLDLQTTVVQMAANSNDKGSASTSNSPVNAFTELLSKAADDSTLKQKIVMADEKQPQIVAKVAEKKPDSLVNANADKTIGPTKQPVNATEKTNTTTANTTKQTPATTIKEPAIVAVSTQKQEPDAKKNEPLQTAVPIKGDSEAKVVDDKTKQDKQGTINTEDTPFARSKVIRKSESSTTEGFGITYVDVQPDGKQDTIKILIPAANENKTQATEVEEKTKDTAIKKNDELVKDPVVVTDTKPANKNTCKLVASDADFYKLRKKMAGEKSDDAMLGEANKLFKTKCFTTNQIKNLGTLFLGDGGKYNFFDVAYQHVSDAENFASLQSELKDEYFINRFKAMLR